MALLQYDISVVGARNVERALAGIERRFVAHNRKMSRMLGPTTGRTATGRAGTNGAAAQARVAASAQRRVHAERMQQVSQEERARIRAEHRIHRIARRNQLRRARANRRERIRDERAAARAQRQFRGAVYGNVRGTMGTVGRYGLMAASLGGGLALAGSLEAERSVDKEARGLAIQGQRSQGKALGGTVDSRYRRVRKTVGNLGRMGFDREGVVRAMRGYQSITGDFETANALAGELSKLALTSGADYGDVGQTAGEFDMALKGQGMVDDKKRRAAVQSLMRSAAASGAMGSIEFAELAKISSKLGASGSRYTDMDPVERIKFALSAAQLAKIGGASSGEEAGTALMRASDDMLKNRGRFKALGIDTGTYDDAGVRVGTKNPMQLLAEAMTKTKGDVGIISELFGIRGAKIGENLMGQARAQGVSIEELLKPFMNATLSDADLNRDTKFALGSTDAQLTAVTNKFNEKLGPKMAKLLNKLLPSIEKLFPLFEKGADQLGKFIDWFSENPIKGIGAIVAAAIAKDVASAAIGNAIKNAMGVGNSGAPGGGGGSKLGNTMAAASLAAAAWGLAFDQWSSLANEVGAKGGSLREVWSAAMAQLEDIAPRNAKMQDERRQMARAQGMPQLETENTALYSSPLGGIAEMFGFDMTPDRYRVNDDGTRTQVSSVDATDTSLQKMAAEAQAALTKAAQELSGAATKLSTATPQTTGGTGIPNRTASPTAP